MNTTTDKKVLEVLDRSTKQLATPVAIFATGYFVNKSIDVPWAEGIGKFFSLFLCFLSGYFTAKVSSVARSDLREIALPTYKLYGYYVVLTFMHLFVFIAGAYAVLAV